MQENASGIFHSKTMEEVKSFKRCLEQYSVYECASNNSKHQSLGKLHIGLYATHIKKWLQFYPRENFFFIRTEDI